MEVWVVVSAMGRRVVRAAKGCVMEVWVVVSAMGRGVVRAAKGCVMGLRRESLLGLHVAYFLVLSMVGTVLLWAAPKAGGAEVEALSFVDALFNAVSALTETGLPSVPMHRFSLPAQLTLLLLMLVGAQVFTSAIALFLRSLLLRRRPPPTTQALPTYPTPICPHADGAAALHPDLPTSPPPPHRLVHTSLPLSSHDPMLQQATDDKALIVMSRLTACHYVFSVATGFLICQICISCSPHSSAVLQQHHINSSLFALFATVSAFGNCGYILLDENMVPLQRSWVMLLCLSAVMLLGNTLYAPTMRLWIWLLHKTARGERKKVYEHILGSKQRVYTHLFPSEETVWLVGTVVFLNTFQVMCMLSLDWRSEALKGLGAGYKLVAALFQTINARTGGMNVVNLSGFSSATLFVSLVAMYIASYPVYLIKEPTSESKRNIFVSQLYKLRKKDILLFVAMFFIFLFERESIMNDPLNFSFFNLMYEVISAYGNVGLTIGYNCTLKTIITSTKECTDIPTAFSGRWTIGGKMVLVMVMLFGRHTNLFKDCDWQITPPLNMLSSS